MHSGLVEEKISTKDSSVASCSAQAGLNESSTIVESRFGPIAIQPENAICFQHGLPGIPEPVNFCITDLPNANTNQFKLLQCLNDLALSFIVMPGAYETPLLEISDIENACTVLGINKNNLLLLFIVTVHETVSGTRLAINAKAPIFADISNKTATQYIFQNEGYEIKQFIS